MWDIVFEHKDFVVINKRCGVSVHCESEGDVCLTASLAQQLGVERVWLVHRLDKATSGLLLFALNRDSAAALSAQFAEKTMRKTYLALGTHKPAKKQGWVKGSMARSRRGTWKLTRDEDNFAVTRFSSQSLKPGLRLFVLQPFTGKTHQLRVAMKSIGSPILGDTLYGGDEAEHLFLHAWRLVFDYRGEHFDIRVAPDKTWPSEIDLSACLGSDESE